jgi:hypothetical protein
MGYMISNQNWSIVGHRVDGLNGRISKYKIWKRTNVRWICVMRMEIHGVTRASVTAGTVTVTRLATGNCRWWLR